MNSARPSVSRRDAHERLGDRLARAARRGAARMSARVGSVVDASAPCSTYTPREVEPGGVFASALAIELGARRGVVERARAASARSSDCSARHAGDAVEERAVLRDRTAGRCRAPSSAGAARRRPRPPRRRSSRMLAEQLGAGVALREPERDRATGAPVDLGHPVHLGARALVVGARSLEPRRDLVDALAVPAEHVADREQLVGRRPTCPAPAGRRGRGAAACARSRSRARRRPSPRRRGRPSRAMSSSVAGRLVEPALAHRVVAHRAVADHAADVDALRHAVDLAEVLAVGLPVPREALEDARGGDVLDRLHELGEPRRGRPAGTGANVTPQLPSTTDVTPCQHDDVASGSHASCASRWVWMSTKPGVTYAPSASIVRVPRPSTSPTSTMRSPSIATSPVNAGGARSRRRSCRP